MANIFVAGVFCLTAALGAGAEAPPGSTPNIPEGEDIVTAVSYNVQFLPGLGGVANRRPNPRYRAHRLAEEMSQFDIIGLQELFEERWRTELLEALDAEWDGKMNAVKTSRHDWRYNGGLAIMTRKPIIAWNEMAFEHISSPADYGFRADGFVTKGVLHARIARDEHDHDNFIDVYVTHLEARASYLRVEQYREMAEFIWRTSSPGRPALVLGDLNTRGNPEYMADPESAYHQMMGIFRESRPRAEWLDVWPHLMGPELLGGTNTQESIERGNRIDYVIVSNPPPPARQLTPKTIWIDPYADEEVEYLSDHNAVISALNWPRD